MRKFGYAAAAITAWVLLYLLLTFLESGHRKRYLDEQTAMQNLAWEAATRINHGVVRTYFNEYVMQPETLKILKAAQEPMDRPLSRARLHHRLEGVNRRLQEEGFRQFHFHLPGGESLLRFHKPDAYGDNLFDVRFSVKIANTELRPVFGFEAGRIYSGFRSVFPIVDPDYGHLGSVELSMPFEALRKAIAELMPEREFLFVVSGKQHERVLFERQKNLYALWALHPDFWVEDPWRILPDAPKPLSAASGCMLKEAVGNPELKALLDRGASGTVAVPLEEGNHALMILTAVRDTQGELAGYLVGVRPTGEVVRFERTLCCGLLVGAGLIILLMLSVWHLNANRRRLQETNGQLDRALAAEKQFIASISHEMRTPLNSVIGYLELLTDVGLKGQAQEFAQKASRSAQHLFALINDILDLSKLEAGQLELSPEPVDVPALMRECADMIIPALKPGVKLDLESGSACCPPVLDPMRLRQIFINLLSNAAKFTRTGRIRFFYESSAGKEGTMRLLFGVEDTGTGIDPDKMAELFKPFRRAHGSHYEGTGLGLYLSRTLAEKMGGSLQAVSKPGQGSLFTLVLNIPCCAPSPEVKPDCSHLKVLMIEDEPLQAELARELFLNAFNLRLEVAAHAEGAVERLASGGVDLVLADAENPGLQLPALLRAIRAFNLQLPVVLISSNPDRIEEGFAATLAKPIRKDQLARLLATLQA